MSPAAQAMTPTNEDQQAAQEFILEESEVPCETEDDAVKEHQQQFQSDM